MFLLLLCQTRTVRNSLAKVVQSKDLDPPVKDVFRLLAYCFLLFCSDLALLISRRYSLTFKYPIESQHRDLGKGNYSYLSPSPSSVLF